MKTKLTHFCRITLLFFYSSMAMAVTFDGSVKLPAGEVAPSSGVTVQVSTFPIEFDFNGTSFSTSSDTITIAPGSNSANYTFQVSDGFSNGSVKLGFECAQDCTDLEVTSDGAVNLSDGISTLITGTDFSTNSNQSINVNLEPATVFIGAIKIPAGITATGNEFLTVRARSQARFSFTSYSNSVLVNPGQQTIPFALGVPLDDGNDGWLLELDCLECEAPLISERQFATTASGNPLSTSEDSAFFFDNSSNYRGLSLTFLVNAVQQPNSKTTISPILLLLDD